MVDIFSNFSIFSCTLYSTLRSEDVHRRTLYREIVYGDLSEDVIHCFVYSAS